MNLLSCVLCFITPNKPMISKISAMTTITLDILLSNSDKEKKYPIHAGNKKAQCYPITFIDLRVFIFRYAMSNYNRTDTCRESCCFIYKIILRYSFAAPAFLSPRNKCIQPQKQVEAACLWANRPTASNPYLKFYFRNCSIYRIRNVATSARVAVPSGTRVVSECPLISPSETVQSIAVCAQADTLPTSAQLPMSAVL
jgi:hypothetical protein